MKHAGLCSVFLSICFLSQWYMGLLKPAVGAEGGGQALHWENWRSVKYCHRKRGNCCGDKQIHSRRLVYIINKEDKDSSVQRSDRLEFMAERVWLSAG